MINSLCPHGGWSPRVRLLTFVISSNFCQLHHHFIGHLSSFLEKNVFTPSVILQFELLHYGHKRIPYGQSMLIVVVSVFINEDVLYLNDYDLKFMVPGLEGWLSG